MKKRICLSSYLLFLLLITPTAAGIKPGDIITQETISHAKGLLTPSPRWMVERGMRMAALDTKRVEWPKAYKKATDKYASQVVLSDTGTELHHYIAGAPFPTIDLSKPASRLCGIMSRILTSSTMLGPILILTRIETLTLKSATGLFVC